MTSKLNLIVHSTMCTGDAAMLGYMSGHGKRRVYTFDDADRKEAYFYASLYPDEMKNISLTV